MPSCLTSVEHVLVPLSNTMWDKNKYKAFLPPFSERLLDTFRQEELPEGLTMVIQTNMNPQIAVRLLLLTPSPNEAPNASL